MTVRSLKTSGSDSYGASVAGSDDSFADTSATTLTDNSHPAADLYRRTHGGSLFARGHGDEPISCFVSLRNEPLAGFVENGPLEPLLLLSTFVKMVTSADPNPHHVLRYNDSRSALQVVKNFDSIKTNSDAVATFTTASQYCEMQAGLPNPETLCDLEENLHQGFDGQVLVQARACMHEDSAGASTGDVLSKELRTHLVNEAYWFARSFGDLKAGCEVMQNFNCKNPCIIMIHLEFHCPGDAEEIIDFARAFPRGWTNKGCKFWATYFDPTVFANYSSNLHPADEDGRDPLAGFRRRWSTSDNPVHHIRQQPEVTKELRQWALIRGSVRTKPRGNVSTDNSNTVLVSKIRDGTDIRTTVMLRNIPNRITKRELLDILSHWTTGKIDFFYLRKDFRTGLNVGYCFLNFIDQDDLARFALEVQGFQWPNSEKHAEISYATMQGKESLVQKFRNSSVMREDWEFRPSLLYTKGHPRSGEEEDFPHPDNLTKMERSCQNATAIGLFSPARNRAPMTRTRRTPYDRGNSYSRVEELERENRTLREREREQRLLAAKFHERCNI